MTLNPGKTVTIYNVVQFLKDASYVTFSDIRLQNSRMSNTNIFTDKDLLFSFVTDRPHPSQNDTDFTGIYGNSTTDF